jgi:uncharacterized protein
LTPLSDHRRTFSGLAGAGLDPKFQIMNAMVETTMETPCVKLCVVDPVTGFCIGCGRTRLEVASWLDFSPQERRQVMAGLDQRMRALTASHRRRGGRRGRLNGD